MATISESGNFLNRPENGAEYGSDVGAQGILNANVFTPFSGKVIGIDSNASTGWSPGRVLIQVDPSQGGGVIGIGHINPGVSVGQSLSVGDLIGTVGDSSRFGGTPESNAHIEAMYAQAGQPLTYAGFTSGINGSQEAKASLDQSLGIAALTRSGTIGADVNSITANTQAGTYAGGAAQAISPTTAGSTSIFAPSDCGDKGGITDPAQTIGWFFCQIGNQAKSLTLIIGFIMLGIVIIGVGLLSTKQGNAVAKTGAKAAIA